MKTPKEIVVEEDLTSLTDPEFDRLHDRIVTRAYGDPAGISGWEVALCLLDDEFTRRYGIEKQVFAEPDVMRRIIAKRTAF